MLSICNFQTVLDDPQNMQYVNFSVSCKPILLKTHNYTVGRVSTKNGNLNFTTRLSLTSWKGRNMRESTVNTGKYT